MSKFNYQAFDDFLDEEGYLLSLDRWDESVAVELACRENIKLTEAHWEIIRLIRKFYQRYQMAPASRALISYVKKSLAQIKDGASM